MKQYRKEGWKPEELKLYWNLQQIENLCRRNENVVLQETNEHMIDPSDKDAYENLRIYPVGKRNHSTNFEFINKGIEQAVFDAPVDVQLIVLNFAVGFILSISMFTLQTHHFRTNEHLVVVFFDIHVGIYFGTKKQILCSLILFRGTGRDNPIQFRWLSVIARSQVRSDGRRLYDTRVRTSLCSKHKIL